MNSENNTKKLKPNVCLLSRIVAGEKYPEEHSGSLIGAGLIFRKSILRKKQEFIKIKIVEFTHHFIVSCQIFPSGNMILWYLPRNTELLTPTPDRYFTENSGGCFLWKPVAS